MLRRLFLLGVIPVIGCALVCPAAGQEDAPATLVPSEHHAWARFQPGAWRRVRMQVETLDQQGRIVSTSSRETLTTLNSISTHSVDLMIQTMVEVGGREFHKRPHSVKQGLEGNSPADQPLISSIGNETININGREVPCEIRRLEANGNASKRITTCHYSKTVAPYVLKQLTTSTAADGQTVSRTTVDVVAIGMPYKVLTDVKNASWVKTVQNHVKGTNITLEVHCMGVPGAVVAHTAKELDEKGRLVRRSTLELLDYGLADEANPWHHQTHQRIFDHSRKFRR